MSSVGLLRLCVKVVWLVFLSTPGFLAQDWNVTHVPSRICAVHHSSVILPCKCTYPRGQNLTDALWYFKKEKGGEPVVVSPTGWSSRRVEASTKEVLNCSLTLSDVTQDNAGIYRFSFRTNASTQSKTNDQGVTLEITDLQVEVVAQSDEVIEGEWVTLICGTCFPSLTVPVYIWHKDGHQHSRRDGDNLLYLSEVRTEDGGSYSCSIAGKEGLFSSAVNFTVKYPPKNISVSISPSGEIVEGSPVTMTCSSDASPVQNYTWFKGSSLVGTGETYNMSNLSSEDSGQYVCQSGNKYGQRRSTAVQFHILHPPKRVSVSISTSGEVVEGSPVTLTCSSDGNPPVKNYTWFKEGGPSPVGSGHSLIINVSAENGGLYYCVAENKYGAQISSPVPVTLNGGQSVIVYISVGAGLCGIAVLFSLIVWMRNKRQNQKQGTTDKLDFKKADPKDDTYAALDLTARSDDDVYHTLATVHPNPHTSDYENLATLKNSSNSKNTKQGHVDPNVNEM